MERLSTEAAAAGTHAAVLEILSSVPERGNLLDVPCGLGALSQKAAELGFTVTGGDLVTREDLALTKEAFVALDLNESLPFDDASFDSVISIEGVEHVHNPNMMIRELSRVLRPGGTLIVSTPNVLCVRSRWSWFKRGHHRHFAPVDGGFQSGHIHPIDFRLLETFLDEAGLEISFVSCNRMLRSLKDRIIGWFLRRTTKSPNRLLSQDTLLFGEILIVKAKKGAAQSDP